VEALASKSFNQFGVLMSYALSLAVASNALAGENVTMNAKGKTGSFGRAIAFAGRAERLNLGAGVILSHLKNGNYRPVISDILGCGIVPKVAEPWVSALVPANGRPSKEQLVALCSQVKTVVDSKRNKAGEPVVLKGEKLFMYGLISAIVNDANVGDIIEA